MVTLRSEINKTVHLISLKPKGNKVFWDCPTKQMTDRKAHYSSSRE